MLHVMRKKCKKKNRRTRAEKGNFAKRRTISSGQLQDRLKFELYTEIRAGV